LLDPTTGLIDIRGTLQLQDGNKIRSSAGTKVVVGDDTDYLKTITKNANKGFTGVAEPKVKNVFRKAKEVVTDQQEELVKLIVEGARKAGLPEDFAERIVLRKVKS
jgi:hypothetical protein